MTASIHECDSGLPALQIDVDAGLPGIYLVSQQVLALFQDVIMPALLGFQSGFGTGHATVVHVRYGLRYPIHLVLNGTRVVPCHGVGSHYHKHIGEAVGLNPQEGRQFLFPLLLQTTSIDAAYVYPAKTAEYSVEARGIDNEIEFELPFSG